MLDRRPPPLRYLDEDSLTPAERAEALALFKRGKWSGGSFAQLQRRTQREESAPTAIGHRRSSPPAPLFSSGEIVAIVGTTIAAYFAGSWWGRHRRRAPPPPHAAAERTADLRGLDVVLSIT